MLDFFSQGDRLERIMPLLKEKSSEQKAMPAANQRNVAVALGKLKGKLSARIFASCKDSVKRFDNLLKQLAK